MEFVAATRSDIEDLDEAAVPIACDLSVINTPITLQNSTGFEIISPDGSLDERPQASFLMSVEELTRTVQVGFFGWASTVACPATAGAGNPCTTSSSTCGQAFCCGLCCLAWPLLHRCPRLSGWLVYLWSILHVLCFEMTEWQRFLDDQLEACRQQWFGRTRLVFVRLAIHIDCLFRGVAQVVFVNNPVGGVIIAATMINVYTWVGFLALLSAIAATLAAELFALDWTQLRQGLYTYNGYLVGAGLATFLQPSDLSQPFHSWSIVLLSLLGGALSPLVHAALTSVVSPAFTLSFASINTLIFLGARQYSAFTDIAAIAPSFPVDTSSSPALHLSVDFIARSLFCGVSQIYFMSSAFAGMVLLGVMALCNPLLAIVALLGSAQGLLLAALFGAPPDDIRSGLWGFNTALAFMAMFTFLRPAVVRSYLVAVATTTLAFIFYAGLRSVFQTLGAPASTFAFCLASIIGLALRHHVPGIGQLQYNSPAKRNS